MSRSVIYMCHPVAGNVDSNISRALRWLAWLRKSYPETTFIAPWIAGILAGEDDDDPVQREAGLVDCEAVIALCDAVILVGGRISSGMARERSGSRRVIDLTHMGEEPPPRLASVALHTRWTPNG